ncbi:hypothetical protein [Faecalicoccus pleomorphus]|uniref:hypothetical protein n=1 Tax=Faecalicoccus pleomorphus TaxID=1323 RepID=UPI0025A381DA|nr:hypothetical protein [Faecalicoccus pleomorphus]MDM8292426.1 hypothetical protein [Faecalicoccus pleomorphus]
MIPAVAAPLVANAEGTQPAAEEKQIPQQIEFVLADGTVVQTSTVNLTTGAHQFSELTLPQGYELVSDGSFTVVSSADIIPVTVRAKEAVEETATVIASLQFIDADGNYAGGGDYFVDLDDDGIANYSELQLPEGYELIQTGDFFVDANNPYTITLHKVQTHEVEQDTATLVVKYVKEGTNEVVGEDEAYTADGVKGEVHTFNVDLKAPKGYELVEDEDSLSLDVEYGQNAEVFVKVKAVEDKNEGKEDEEKTDAKEDSKKEDKGVDTGVAMPLAGIFGTMSVALGGMIALLRRKNRK